MSRLGHVLGRHRRAVVLLVLMVLLPASAFTVLTIRAVQTERVRADHERTRRQRQIVRLVEADLYNWLFSMRAGSALSTSLLRFRIDGDRILFPEFQLSVPHTGVPRQRPFGAKAAGERLTEQSVTDLYYPRIQAFLRDLRTGRGTGAQHFLRLGAVVVRPPGRDDGYVVEVPRVLQHIGERLADFASTESFEAAVSVSDFNARTASTAGVYRLEGFPFFEVTFREKETGRLIDVRRHAFTFVMALLALTTILGSARVYRALSQEVRLSRLRSDFVAAVSHEFRSPLSSILALSERLEAARVRDQEKLSQYHQMIGQDARRLTALVTRLLDFAQIEEGKRAYSPERVELVALAREAIRSSHHSVRPERIQLVGEDAAPLWVRADRVALRHGIQNLIENAAKYSAPDSLVTLACGSANGAAFVEVQDRGVGIPLPEQQRIFEKFYRGSRASELNVPGVGIGLALVKHVAESHGGSVSVQSQPGQGSRFRLRLPRAEA
jgi:two-component system phosphate regulon sensor histidine kinase PhoR